MTPVERLQLDVERAEKYAALLIERFGPDAEPRRGWIPARFLVDRGDLDPDDRVPFRFLAA